MTDIDSAHRAYLALRERSDSAMLATMSPQNTPAASYAPLVWHDDCCYLFLSQLASHARNLDHCPAISLMLIEAENEATNPFARQRITLQGEARVVARETDEFERVLASYHERFGKIMAIIEPLPDFRLFRVQLSEGRFVKGFGQAYALTGERLERLSHIDSA